MDAQTEEVDSKVKQFYTAWASGQPWGDFSGAAGIAQTRAGRTAADLYELHVMGPDSCDWADATRRVKDWAYMVAAEFVSTRRGPARFVSYRLDWGHQAARDGVAEALWPHIRGTGLAIRAIQFDIGERPYQRVRDHVKDEAKRLLNNYETELSAAIGLDMTWQD